MIEIDRALDYGETTLSCYLCTVHGAEVCCAHDPSVCKEKDGGLMPF